MQDADSIRQRVTVPEQPSAEESSSPKVNKKRPCAAVESAPTSYFLEKKTALMATSCLDTSPLVGLEDVVHFIESDNQRQQVIQQCRDQSHGRVIPLRSPDNLNHHHLLQTVTCPPGGTLSVTEGRLFADDPLTLVLDLTEMTAGQIASMNDLLEIPPSCQGKRLGPSVRRVILVSESMLNPGFGKPGPDCWRRLQNFPIEHSCPGGQKEDVGVLSDKELLQERVTVAEDDSGSVSVNLAVAENWRIRLFGGMVLDDRGQVRFQPGALEGLQPADALILQDAPWDDPDFTITLARALREEGFEANGEWVSLPASVRLRYRKSSPQVLEVMKQRLVKMAEECPYLPDVEYCCLNSQSLEDAFCTVQIRGGISCAADSLSELLSGCQVLCITDPLSDGQWLRLLNRIAQIKPSPTLIDLTKAAKEHCPKTAGQIHCHIYRQEIRALAEPDPASVVYRITPQTRWDTLWLETRLLSRNSGRFDQDETALLQALRQGQAVVCHGLETCPDIALRLESLFANPPYLLVHGRKILLPEANLIFLWPENMPCPLSSLWQKQFQLKPLQGEPEKLFEEPLHQLMALLQALPASARKTYPAPPPWEAADFPALLAKQIELEMRQDCAHERLPVHYHKALHTLIVKCYRGDDEVYGYLKTSIKRLYPEEGDYLADGHALRQWLSLYPDADRSLLEQQFWSLVRHCPLMAFKEILPGGFKRPTREALDKLAGYITGAAEDEHRTELAGRLQVNASLAHQFRYYHGQRRAQIRDALSVAGELRKMKHIGISCQAKKLDNQINNIIEGHGHNCTEAINGVCNVLQYYFDGSLLQGDFHDLAEALVMGRRNSHYRQYRRIQQLAERVQLHGCVFLQGVAGAGKSHMARSVAGELKKMSGWENMPAPEVLSLGPETTAENLFGEQQLEERMDDDQSSSFVPGPVLRWAMAENPPLLILDEANLAREGILAPLAGLNQNPPRICYNGRIYRLSDRHRVVLTGNPDHYDGRHMDSTISKNMLTLFCRPLTPEVLAELVIQPALPDHWPIALKTGATTAIMALYRHYGDILPDALSPRDLQDILSRIHQALRYGNQDRQNQKAQVVFTPPMQEQVNQMVDEAFADSLGGRVSANCRLQADAIRQWYPLHYPCDSTLSAKKQLAFQVFLQALRQKNPAIDLESTPVVNLVRHYWLFLDQQTVLLRGRRSLIVEGPAGWGKDLIARCVLVLWEDQKAAVTRFVHINACPDQWDAQIRTIRAAMGDGRIVVISELNLLPSRYLEGLFNEYLSCGYTKPGFALIMTVNPGSLGGRETLSMALKSRCTIVQLERLSQYDLQGVLQRRGSSLALSQWLSGHYQALADLLEQRQAPIQLCLDDLFRAANALLPKDRNEWPTVFASVFGLALGSVHQTMGSLQAAVCQAGQQTGRPGQEERTRILFCQLNSKRRMPLTLQMQEPDTAPHWNASRKTLLLPDTGTVDELLELACLVLEPCPGTIWGSGQGPSGGRYNDIRTFHNR